MRAIDCVYKFLARGCDDGMSWAEHQVLVGVAAGQETLSDLEESGGMDHVAALEARSKLLERGLIRYDFGTCLELTPAGEEKIKYLLRDVHR